MKATDGRTIINGGLGPDEVQPRPKSARELAVPKEDRTTTPYMTKYAKG